MTEKKIGVLYILDNLAIGGAQQIVLTLAENINKERFHVAVCTLFSRYPELQEPLADELRHLNIPVYKLAMSRWRDWDTIKTLVQIIDKENIDIVHSHMVPAEFWGSILAKIFRRKKAIYTRHTTYKLEGFSSKAQAFMANRILCDKIVAISDATLHNLVRYCYARREDIVKIYNGVNIRRFSPSLSGRDVRASLDIPPDCVVVGNIGRLDKRKGFHVFLNVASLVVKVDSSVRFLIMGYGSEEPYLKSLARQLNLEKHVIFSKPRRDIPQVLAAIDILLFTPLWGEGLPTIILETMACGRPVIASNTGANRELVVHGVTGFLSSPDKWVMEKDALDPTPLAERVIYLIKNREICRQMGIEGRKVVEQQFSVEKMIRETEALYFRIERT